MDLEELTSSSADSPASLGHKPGSSEAQKMTVTSGRKWLALLQSCDLNISLARMCEALLTSPWASSAAFLIWKTSATKPSHLLFQLAPSTPRTDEIESGLWPTPRSCSAMAAENIQNRVNDKFPNLGGSLNPEWVEWLMGFPAGWTNLTVEELRPELKTASLDLKPSEMPLCRKSSSRSDGRSSRRKKANE